MTVNTVMNIYIYLNIHCSEKKQGKILTSHTFQLQASSDEDSKKKELSESRLENLSSHLEDAMQESGSGSDNGESLHPSVICNV